jgi:hypothetical protein
MIDGKNSEKRYEIRDMSEKAILDLQDLLLEGKYLSCLWHSCKKWSCIYPEFRCAVFGANTGFAFGKMAFAITLIPCQGINKLIDIDCVCGKITFVSSVNPCQRQGQ